MYVCVRREIHARQDKITANLFFSFFFHHTGPSNANLTRLPLARRLRWRRQLKIVSRRRAVTKRTENDGQPDWQRLCMRHYPLQVLRAAAYICMSARIPQPRDAWRLVRWKKKERQRERERERKKKRGEKSVPGEWTDSERNDLTDFRFPFRKWNERDASSDRANIGASSRVGRQQRARGVKMRTGRFYVAGAWLRVCDVHVYIYIYVHTSECQSQQTDATTVAFFTKGGFSPDAIICARDLRSIFSRRPPPGLSYKSKLRFARSGHR